MKGFLQTVAIVPLLGCLTLAGCETNQALGRSQLILFDDNQLSTMAASAWQEQLKTAKISRDANLNARLKTVGTRIVNAAGMGNQPWEFVLFENDQPNAFVLPGNKVGVNTGLFKVVKNDDQLAAVIGHETGHVIGKHANERASQQTAAQVGLETAAGVTSGRTQQVISSYGGLGAQLGLLLPYSRRHETEADRIGVDLMHKAGYKPSEAVKVWENMRTLGGNKPPEIISTHPSDQTRIRDLQAYIASKGYN